MHVLQGIFIETGIQKYLGSSQVRTRSAGISGQGFELIHNGFFGFWCCG